MFKKLICFAGGLLLLSLSLMFCFTLGLWQDWSTPTILLLWLVMLLLVPLLYAITNVMKGKPGRRWLKKYRLSRREYVLLNQWKSGAGFIKRLHRQRKPLPWYLLAGDSCGKSTLLASAGLPRFDGDNDASIVRPTRMLRWWFFRHIGVLELSSNFLNSTPAFRQAWGKLARWCTQMPAPAGIIVALPVSALISDDLSQLHAMARQLRGLIEPLVRRFDVSLPLYVMVTQCDRFPGFSLWHRQLSAAQCQQPLGYSWPSPPHIDGQDEFALQPLFSVLKQGMSWVRLSMVRPATLSAEENLALLNFPEAFAALEPTLRYALASLCEPNVYFSHVSLNSVWFSATEPNADNSGRRVSVFVHDLLAGHLRDLSLRRGIQRWYQRPRGKMACIAILIVCALWVTIGACLSFNRLRPDLALLSPNALALFLTLDEHDSTFSSRYFPFQPLLEKQRQQAESQLALVPSTPRLTQATLDNYRQQTLDAAPALKRDRILQLAHAVLLWQQMRDGASLDVLNQKMPVAVALQQRDYPEALSLLAILALERYYMRRPDGERWLQTARQQLTRLVQHDPTLKWLLAPTASLPALQAAIFWPSLPTTLALPGIWTYAGEITLNDWMTQIEQAIGQPQPVFQQVREQKAGLRQNAWRQFMIDVSTSLSSIPPAAVSRKQLIALGQNQSPAMQFVNRILNELRDIPPAEAQPWLTLLHRLQSLSANRPVSAMLGHVTRMDQNIRLSLTSWLQGSSPEFCTDSTTLANQLWLQWKKARSAAVKEAFAQATPGPRLTRGLFSPTQSNNQNNPLLGLLPVLARLEEHLSPQNDSVSIAAIWALYQDDARRLLGNAMAQNACWLNNQWRSTVIWPLNKDSEQLSYEEQQAQTQQLVSEFLRGPAKTLLTTDSNGIAAANYAGIKAPLTDNFIRFTRQAFSPEITQDIQQRASTRNNDQRASLQAKLDALRLKQSALEEKSWKISVSSQPASVPGGARVMPTGTRLTLNCLKGNQQLSSMNFAEKRDFSWQAGQCPGITLSVIFPGFTVSYQRRGDDAWPWFVNRFTDGEMLFDSSDFADSAGLLEQLEIKQILVRFTVSSLQEMETTWQSWSSLNDHIRDLDVRIASLDERAESPLLNPISALPDHIAQCQSLM